jgi:tetratricopeptide (TPR) repeat protein
MDDLRGALARNDDDAVEAALDALKARGPVALVEGLRLVLDRRRQRGAAEHDLTGVQYRLAQALEDAAALPDLAATAAAAHALQAAVLFRDVLNDGEGATRDFTTALRLAAEDDALLKEVCRGVGGGDPSSAMLEKAAKKAGKSRDDDVLTGRLRRALSRVLELVLFDKERAFFEALKAARKLPGEGALVDDVYRLAVDTGRLDEAAAFFQSLADEGLIPVRGRASALNKLGALHEARKDATAAFAAYVASLQLHETKAARKKAERLKLDLQVSTPLPTPRDAATAPPLPAPVPAPPPVADPLDGGPPALALDLDLPPPGSAPTPAPAGTPATSAPVGMFPIVFPDTPVRLAGLPPPVVVRREDIGLVTAVGDRPLLSIPPPPADSGEGDAFASGVFNGEDGAGAFGDVGDDAIVSAEDDVAPALLHAAAREDARRAAAVAEGVPVVDAASRTAVVSAPDTEDGTLLPEPHAEPRPSPDAGQTAPPDAGRYDGRDDGRDVVDHASPDAAATRGPGADDGPAGEPRDALPTPPFTDPAAVPFVSDPGSVVSMPSGPVAPPSARAEPTHVGPLPPRSSEPEGRPRPHAASSSAGRFAALVAVRPATPTPTATTTTPTTTTTTTPRDDASDALARTAKKAKKKKQKKAPRASTTDEATMPAGLARPDAAPAPVSSLGDGVHPDHDDAPATNPSTAPATSLPTRGTQTSPTRPSADAPAAPTDAAPAALDAAPAATPAAKASPPEPETPAPPTPEPRAAPSREALIARAQAVLAGDDADACLALADELAALVPGDPRVLRLAARALVLEAPGGALSARGVALVVDEARRHGERAATLIREIQLAMPEDARGALGLLWLAGARAAGHDLDRVHALLQDVAAADAPAGPLFSFLDQSLAAAGDVDRRDALLAHAARLLADAAAVDGADADRDARRATLLRRRVTLLEEARRDAAALQAWALLVLEHATDAPTRLAARRAFEQRATPDERARFLARLARRADAAGAAGSEAASILRELLDLRVAVDDELGAEATARDLLARVPGDARAVAVLVELLADDPRRAGELVELLRLRAEAAQKAGDRHGAREALERLARALGGLGRHDEAAAVLADAARTNPADAALVERVLDGLTGARRVAEAVDLLDEIAGAIPPREGARLLVRAATLAGQTPARAERARPLLERAVALQPDDARVLEAWAELLVDGGDVERAVEVLARLAATESDPAVRARLELRRGRLFEEQLLRPHDAVARYRAAVEGDRTLREAWEALLALARSQGDKTGVVDALTGLAQLESGRPRSALLVRLGRVHEKDRNDPVAAAAAYEAALGADPGDVDALTGLLGVRALSLQGERDAEAALAVPAPELVDELCRPLLGAEAVGAALPFSFRRLLALGVTQDGDTEGARRRFEALLEEKPDDLPTLLAFARHLASAGRLPASPAAIAVADARRREVLEAVLLHHAYALKPLVHVDVWGETCALRLQAGDLAGAKKAARKTLALVAAADRPGDLEDVLSDRAVRSLVLALEDILPSDTAPTTTPPLVDEADIDLLEQAIALDFERALAATEKSRLKEKEARVALLLRRDVELARKLLEEALRHDPDASSAREMLFDLELQGEEPRKALEQSRALVAAERDPLKKAQLHLRLFKLHKRVRMPDDAAAAELRAAVELDPKNPAILEVAEKFFAEKKDGKGLDALYTTRLKALDRNDIPGRLLLLERLAQLRRYDVRDLRAAIDACEAMSALDPEAIKPREDAARMHVELGQWKEAVAAWRSVLDRDTLLVEAWRGLFAVFARSRQADEAFAVAATMAALEIADDDMVRAVRAVRPPFPRWPVVPVDAAGTRRKLSHPLERSPVRGVLELVAPRLLPRLGRALGDFGVRRKDALTDKQLSPSVAMAVRTATTLAGLGGGARDGGPMLPLYGAELSSDGATPPFAALPAREPGLIVTHEVLRGGITPERAFALGRAVAWLSPWALLAASLDAAEIRRLIEGLVAAYLSPRDVEKPSADTERYGAELRAELQEGLSGAERDQLAAALAPALRDWIVGRGRITLSEWKAGVGYSGDRLGFLLCSDLPAAVKVVRTAGGSATAARLAIKELVLFSISPTYLQLRRELALALQEQALAPILDLG